MFSEQYFPLSVSLSESTLIWAYKLEIGGCLFLNIFETSMCLCACCSPFQTTTLFHYNVETCLPPYMHVCTLFMSGTEHKTLSRCLGRANCAGGPRHCLYPTVSRQHSIELKLFCSPPCSDLTRHWVDFSPSRGDGDLIEVRYCYGAFSSINSNLSVHD